MCYSTLPCVRPSPASAVLTCVLAWSGALRLPIPTRFHSSATLFKFCLSPSPGPFRVPPTATSDYGVSVLMDSVVCWHARDCQSTFVFLDSDAHLRLCALPVPVPSLPCATTPAPRASARLVSPTVRVRVAQLAQRAKLYELEVGPAAGRRRALRLGSRPGWGLVPLISGRLLTRILVGRRSSASTVAEAATA